MNSLLEKVKEWAIERNLQTGDPKKQTLKLMEEVGELAQGLCKGNEVLVKDSIGDITVVLIILSMQLGVNFEDCLEIAYDEIKHRKGKLVNGIFVKESDLKE